MSEESDSNAGSFNEDIEEMSAEEESSEEELLDEDEEDLEDISFDDEDEDEEESDDISADEDEPEDEAAEEDQDDPDDEDDDDDDDDDDEDKEGSSDEEELTGEAAKGKKDLKPAQDITTVALERTIFVGNLPNNLDHRDVAKIFKSCGPVESARIRSVVPEKEKLSPKVALITGRLHPKVDSVNAFVVFAKTDDDDCIKKALALNGTVIDDHHIRVDRAQQANSKRLTLTSRKKSVFVGNLRFDIRDDDLINHFNKVGSIDYVRLVRDRATGLGKGFGFVKFMERAAVKKALELDDTDFKGRKLRVKKIDEKMKLDEEDKKPSPKFQKKKIDDEDEPQNEARNERPTRGGGNRGASRGGSRFADRGGRGGDRGGDRGGFRGGARGGSRGGFRGNSRGNPRGGFRGGSRGSIQRNNSERPRQFDISNRTDRSQQFAHSKPNKFSGNTPNKQNFSRDRRDSNPDNDKKHVKFDLKKGKKVQTHQKREAPQFDGVKINKDNNKKIKKKTILKKKVNKG